MNEYEGMSKMRDAKSDILKHDIHVLDDPHGSWRKSLLHFSIVIIFIAAVGYLSRGWIRNTVIPKGAVAVEGSSFEKQIASVQNELQHPFTALGYKKTDVIPTKCTLTEAKLLATKVDCEYKIHAYGEVSRDPATIKRVDAASAKIEDYLKNNGWKGEYSDSGQYVSLHKIVTAINQGNDSLPDASYFKQVGDMYCAFSTAEAFNSPKPAAKSTVLTCDKDYYFLGVPTF